MSIAINNQPVAEMTDKELLAWMNDTNRGHNLRQRTAKIWLSVIRSFELNGTPMTVRQMFYQLVSAGTIDKTENEYNSVVYHLLQMRRRGLIPYRFVSDNTRWMRKPKTYDSIEDFLRISQDAYRRSLWANQNAYVEIWCEKDALAGVIYEITRTWDVPLMVTRGFPSESFVYEAAQALIEQDKPAYLYYFGDHDPSGKAIPENTQAKLAGFGANFRFEQVAVNEWQIEAWGLPTRPTKKTDSRAKNWRGESVELDAIPVPRLRELVEKSITQHIDQTALEDSRRVEKLERQTFREFAQNFRLD